MLSKNEFIKYMEIYKKGIDFYNNLSVCLENGRDVIGDAEIGFPESLNAIIELIEIDMRLPRDVYGYTTLFWWACECDFGDREEMLLSASCAHMANNPNLFNPNLRSLEELYDHLVWEREQVKAGGSAQLND